MNESDLLRRVLDTARLYGWRCAHYRPARTEQGWRTPMQGDRGCPDLILARDGQVLLAELKTQTGKLGPGQDEWLRHAGAHGRLWRPDDWPAIGSELALRTP